MGLEGSGIRVAIVAMFALVGSACTAQQVVWNDFTNAGRGTAELQMDSGTCSFVSQQVPPTHSGYCPSCALLDAATTIISRENAYNSCMQSHGWQQVGAVAHAAESEPDYSHFDGVAAPADQR
jgi:hypothetical protein